MFRSTLEGGTERDRQTEIERQTDRQTETGRQRDRQTETEDEWGGWRNEQSERQTDRDIYSMANLLICVYPST